MKTRISEPMNQGRFLKPRKLVFNEYKYFKKIKYNCEIPVLLPMPRLS